MIEIVGDNPRICVFGGDILGSAILLIISWAHCFAYVDLVIPMLF